MRVWKLAALVGAMVVLGATPAYAHVTISAPDAAPGASDVTITFRVPTESDKLSTTELRVSLPIDTPLASVDTLVMPGWTISQKSVSLSTPIHTDDGDITTAVSEIDWKANSGSAIKPGSFGQFVIIAGALPDASSLVFKALQTYSDGSVESWIQTPAAGQTADDLDYPAPTLSLKTAAATAATTAPSSSPWPLVLSVIALVVALVGCGLALIGRRRRAAPSPAEPRTAPTTPTTPTAETAPTAPTAPTAETVGRR